MDNIGPMYGKDESIGPAVFKTVPAVLYASAMLIYFLQS
jgi:hypothetical protein